MPATNRPRAALRAAPLNPGGDAIDPSGRVRALKGLSLTETDISDGSLDV